MTSQLSFFLDKGTSHDHPIFTPGNLPKFKENVMPESIFSYPNSYHSVLLQLQQPPGGSILTKSMPKCVLTLDYNVVTRNSRF